MLVCIEYSINFLVFTKNITQFRQDLRVWRCSTARPEPPSAVFKGYLQRFDIQANELMLYFLVLS